MITEAREPYTVEYRVDRLMKTENRPDAAASRMEIKKAPLSTGGRWWLQGAVTR